MARRKLDTHYFIINKKRNWRYKSLKPSIIKHLLRIFMLPVFIYFISGFVAFWFGVSLCCNCNNNIQNLQLGIYCTQHDTISYSQSNNF